MMIIMTIIMQIMMMVTKIITIIEIMMSMLIAMIAINDSDMIFTTWSGAFVFIAWGSWWNFDTAYPV